MKLYILSDLHLEFSTFESFETDADLVVLAGDIGKRANGILWECGNSLTYRAELIPIKFGLPLGKLGIPAYLLSKQYRQQPEMEGCLAQSCTNCEI